MYNTHRFLYIISTQETEIHNWRQLLTFLSRYIVGMIVGTRYSRQVYRNLWYHCTQLIPIDKYGKIKFKPHTLDVLNFGFFKGPWASYQKTRKQKNSYQPNFKNLIMKIGENNFFPLFDLWTFYLSVYHQILQPMTSYLLSDILVAQAELVNQSNQSN